MAEDHVKIELMAQDMQYLKDGQKSLHEEVKEIKTILQQHVKDEETRLALALSEKANKWVEKAIVFAIIGIITSAGALVWAVTIRGVVVRP